MCNSELAHRQQTQETARFYIACVKSAIVLLHEEGYIHRNVTPQCVYITDAGYAQLADLTCAKRMDGNKVNFLAYSVERARDHSQSTWIDCETVVWTVKRCFRTARMFAQEPALPGSCRALYGCTTDRKRITIYRITIAHMTPTGRPRERSSPFAICTMILYYQSSPSSARPLNENRHTQWLEIRTTWHLSRYRVRDTGLELTIGPWASFVTLCCT